MAGSDESVVVWCCACRTIRSTQNGMASLNGIVQSMHMSAKMHSWFRADTHAHWRRKLEVRYLSHAVANFLTRRLSINWGVFLLILTVVGFSSELQSICCSREMEKHLLQYPYVSSWSSINDVDVFRLHHFDFSCNIKRYTRATKTKVALIEFAKCVIPANA